MRLVWSIDGGEARFFTFSSEDAFWFWYFLLEDIKSIVEYTPTFHKEAASVLITTKKHRDNVLVLGNSQKEKEGGI